MQHACLETMHGDMLALRPCMAACSPHGPRGIFAPRWPDHSQMPTFHCMWVKENRCEIKNTYRRGWGFLGLGQYRYRHGYRYTYSIQDTVPIEYRDLGQVSRARCGRRLGQRSYIFDTLYHILQSYDFVALQNGFGGKCVVSGSRNLGVGGRVQYFDCVDEPLGSQTLRHF